MVHCIHNRCTFSAQCSNAQSMLLCGDCLGCYTMNRTAENEWTATLDLPPGRHSFRYYAQLDGAYILWGQDQVVLDERESTRPEIDLTWKF